MAALLRWACNDNADWSVTSEFFRRLLSDCHEPLGVGTMAESDGQQRHCGKSRKGYYDQARFQFHSDYNENHVQLRSDIDPHVRRKTDNDIRVGRKPDNTSNVERSVRFLSSCPVVERSRSFKGDDTDRVRRSAASTVNIANSKPDDTAKKRKSRAFFSALRRSESCETFSSRFSQSKSHRLSHITDFWGRQQRELDERLQVVLSGEVDNSRYS